MRVLPLRSKKGFQYTAKLSTDLDIYSHHARLVDCSVMHTNFLWYGE